MSDCCPDRSAQPSYENRGSSALKTGLKVDGLSTIVTVAVLIGLIGVLIHHQGGLPLDQMAQWQWVVSYGEAIIELLGASWWGIAFGFVMMFGLSYVPQERITALFGSNDGLSGLWRAIAAGLVLDLCSHGILLIAAQLYRKGVGLPQVVAFLVTSPWNSVSTTIILGGLIGWHWTLLFIGLSLVVGWLTGAIFLLAERRGWLPQPRRFTETALPVTDCHDGEHPDHNHSQPHSWQQRLRQTGSESSALLRWLLLGIVITALMRTFVPQGVFHQWFGPSLIGLVSTLVMATVVEVCSEGSAPIAAELLNRGGAPGNGFTFLMAGASTDVTELLILRQITGSWKTALFLPLVTVPQILLLAWLLNLGLH